MAVLLLQYTNLESTLKTNIFRKKSFLHEIYIFSVTVMSEYQRAEKM